MAHHRAVHRSNAGQGHSAHWCLPNSTQVSNDTIWRRHQWITESSNPTSPRMYPTSPGQRKSLSLQVARMAYGHRGDPCPPSRHRTEGWQHLRCPASSKVHLPSVVPGVPKNTTDPSLWTKMTAAPKHPIQRGGQQQSPAGLGRSPMPQGKLPLVRREPAAAAPGTPAQKFPAQGRVRLSMVVSATARSKAGSNKGPDLHSA